MGSSFRDVPAKIWCSAVHLPYNNNNNNNNIGHCTHSSESANVKEQQNQRRN